jgi:hypothetical protein
MLDGFVRRYNEPAVALDRAHENLVLAQSVGDDALARCQAVRRVRARRPA